MTNFFEITIDPEVNELFLTNRTDVADNGHENITTNFDKSKLLSLHPTTQSQSIGSKPIYLEWLLKKLLFDELAKQQDVFDLDYRSGEFTLLNENLLQKTEYSLLRRLIVQIFHANGKLFLALDPITKKYNRLSLSKLIEDYNFSQQEFLEQSRCLVYVEKRGRRKWVQGRIVGFLSDDLVKVEVPALFDGTIEAKTTRILPAFNKKRLIEVLREKHLSTDIEKETKPISTLTSRQKYKAIMKYFEEDIFPLFPFKVGNTTISISKRTISSDFFPRQSIPQEMESKIVVAREGLPSVTNKKVLPALSKVTYPPNLVTTQKIVLFAEPKQLRSLRKIVSQLNGGITDSYGNTFSMPLRFGIQFEISDEFPAETRAQLLQEIDRYLASLENKHTESFPFLYLSKMSSVYYDVKAKLAFHAKASQVISTPTFDIYSAWNLATNLYAKLGNIPWGISENDELANADIILGLAYSTLKRDSRLQRKVGFVNVFDKNGVWLFVKSSSQDIDFNHRLAEFPHMIRNAFLTYTASGKTPQTVDIHYSKRFSFRERQAIFETIRAICPQVIEVNFISFDTTHPLRMFDESTRNLDVQRGTILILNQNAYETELLLATSNIGVKESQSQRFQRVRIWRLPNDTPPDVKGVAYRILAMTKLNWRSAVRDTNEPVTLRYAHEIAKLTNQFSLTEWTSVNNQLSNIPWFI